MNYKQDIRDKLGNKKIDCCELIETIILIYGKPVIKEEIHFRNRIVANQINKYIEETVMNDILTKLLGKDGVRAMWDITMGGTIIENGIPVNVPFPEKFNWRYHTSDGEGYITEKNT